MGDHAPTGAMAAIRILFLLFLESNMNYGILNAWREGDEALSRCPSLGPGEDAKHRCSMPAGGRGLPGTMRANP